MAVAAPMMPAEAPSAELISRIEYSEKYMDDNYEYRHVILPKELAKMLPKGKLLSDAEWRAYGVQQSRGWEHYAVHKPEPHILLFRRPLGTDPTTGRVNPALREAAIEAFNREYEAAAAAGGAGKK